MDILSTVVLLSAFNCAEKCVVFILNALDIRVSGDFLKVPGTYLQK